MAMAEQGEHGVAEDFFAESIKRYYDSPGVPEVYAAKTGLLAAERFLLEALAGELRQAVLLDIGVGPGRTVPFLRPACRRYVGIDYSLNMLRIGRSRFPGTPLALSDARTACFADGSFDAVFFCNAIDDVGHEDRLRILAEAHRLLRAPGVFVFSAHNMDAELRSPWAPPRLAGPLGEKAAALRRYGAGIVNHLRSRRHQQRTEGRSVRSDAYFDFGLLTYYVSREEQERQLAETGFASVEAVSAGGRPLAPGERCSDAWIFFAARKV
jgi:SAM-dependent methyltransferase